MTKATNVRNAEIGAVVFGGGGMLGRALGAAFAAREIPVTVVDRATVDVTSGPLVRDFLEPQLRDAAGRVRQLVVVNAAAMTHVDACEDQPAAAMRVNAWGAHALHSAIRSLDSVISFVQISTGGVFEGRPSTGVHEAGYDEFAQPAAVGHYTYSKWAAEELLTDIRAWRFLRIVRLQHLYGPGGKGGLATARRRLVDPTPDEREFGIYGEHLRRITPTYAADAARAIATIGLDPLMAGTPYPPSPFVHLAPTGSVTEHGFLKELQHRVGSQVKVRRARYEPMPTETGRGQLVAVDKPDTGKVLRDRLAFRPPSALLRTSRAGTPWEPPSLGTWQEGLARYLADEAGLTP